MKNYEIEKDEVILFEDTVNHSDYADSLQLTLTSKKLVFEKGKNAQNKKGELIEIIDLQDIKIYKEKVQVSQKNTDVAIQTINKNFTITFSGVLNATNFVNKIVDTITDSTLMERGSKKVKSVLDFADKTLGLNVKKSVTNALETGITGVIIGLFKKD
ncbi:MAG: hypothetical protein ACI4TX_04340 [Christensenellales bacterium]